MDPVVEAYIFVGPEKVLAKANKKAPNPDDADYLKEDDPLIESFLEMKNLERSSCLFIGCEGNIFEWIPFLFADSNGDIFENLQTNKIKKFDLIKLLDRRVCVIYL